MWVKIGDKVRVARPLGGLEKVNVGKTGEVVRFAKPHGYAVLKTPEGEIQVHPEALDQV